VKGKLFTEGRFLLVNYFLVPLLGIIICLLEAFGRIRFVRFDRFPIWEEKMIIVANHPSLLEPLLLPLMGFPWMNFPWVFSPLWTQVRFSFRWFKDLRKEFVLQRKLVPANVPDKQNFYDPPYMGLFQGINVPVDRNGSAGGRIGTVLALKKILEDGGRVLIFPEGGRTLKAVQRPGGINNSEKLGGLKDGAAWLALKTGARIVPVWVQGTDKVLPNGKFPFPRLNHRITIKIGEPFRMEGITRQEATAEIARVLLSLAGEK